MSEEIEYPSLGQQGKNLAKFTFEVIKEAFKGGQEKLFVNPEIQKQRLEICSQCHYFDPNQGRCKSCGCFLVHKVKFSLESCPVGKWSISDEDWMNGVYEQIEETINNPEPEIDRPRFPIDVRIGDKYSWTMPEPDGRTLHWYWNGSTWEFDPNPDEPVYTDEEIAAFEQAKAEMMQQEKDDAMEALRMPLKEEMEWPKMKKELGLTTDEDEEDNVEEDVSTIDSLIDEIAMNTLDEVVEEVIEEVIEEDKPKKKRGRPKKVENTEN